MTTLNIPLVGMHFHPPAKEVLSILPLGFKLVLRPEPTNLYDSNAVEVLADLGDLPTERFGLLQDVLPVPYDAHSLCSEGLLFIGYLAATGKKTAKGGSGNVEALLMLSAYGIDGIEAKLASAPEGYPTVLMQVKE